MSVPLIAFGCDVPPYETFGGHCEKEEETQTALQRYFENHSSWVNQLVCGDCERPSCFLTRNLKRDCGCNTEGCCSPVVLCCLPCACLVASYSAGKALFQTAILSFPQRQKMDI